MPEEPTLKCIRRLQKELIQFQQEKKKALEQFKSADVVCERKKMVNSEVESEAIGGNPNDNSDYTFICFDTQPSPEDICTWYFIFNGPKDTPYAGGSYIGKIVYPSNYPFEPPNFVFLTPNGRFITNCNICLSISSYHPESWSPVWNITTILKALYSFFICEDRNENRFAVSLGAAQSTEAEKIELARESKKYNVTKLDQIYARVFPESYKKDLSQIENSKRMDEGRYKLRNGSRGSSTPRSELWDMDKMLNDKHPVSNSRVRQKYRKLANFAAALVILFIAAIYLSA